MLEPWAGNKACGSLFQAKNYVILKGRKYEEWVTMFQIERLEKIRTILQEKGSADVIWLSASLKVSEVTIRRDLEKLEAEGFLKRTYGGAVLAHQPAGQPAQAEKAQTGFMPRALSQNSRRLGEMCLGLIENHDIIFLADCDANIALAEKLDKKNGVVVFTNSLAVLWAMRESKRNRIALTGGEVNLETKLMTLESVNVPFPDIRINKAFFQFTGADFEQGLSVNIRTEAMLYRELKSKSRQMVGIMEGSAFDKAGLIKLGELTEIDVLVADGDIPKNYKEVFYQNGVAVHQKFDL